MTTVININPNLFIDIEGACINSSIESDEDTTTIKVGVVPISKMKGSKFRRIFNRHRAAFRR